MSDAHVIQSRVVQTGVFGLFWEEADRARAAFPEIMPTCREEDFFSHRLESGRQAYYLVTPMLQYLGMAIGQLKAAAEEVETTPITNAVSSFS